MGFFSSIGKVFKKVAAPVAGAVGTILGGPAAGAAGAAMAGSIWGGDDSSGSDWQKSAYDDQMALAREQFDFNKQYIQNQMQWRVADAQKAGLHPMAALGLNGASFSGVSMPSIPNIQDSTYDPVELGQSIAYASAKAKTNEQQEQAFLLSQSLGAEQIKGVQLDNELKQLEIASLASRLTQATPAAPNLNGGRNFIGGQNDVPYSLDSPYGKDLHTLFTIARHGDTLTETPHPDIADSIIESEWKNIIAHIDAEAQAADGTIKPPVYLLTPSEQKAVREHRYELRRVPGFGWKLDRNPSRPHPYDNLSKYEKFKRKNTQRWDGKQSVSGKIFY